MLIFQKILQILYNKKTRIFDYSLHTPYDPEA